MNFLKGQVLLFGFLLIGISLQAQSAVLRGTVRDKVTNGALEYSSISVLNMHDSTVVAGGVTAATGDFEGEGLADNHFWKRFLYDH